MGQPYRVQHRQRSESREVELKTELQQLRSQNQRLRRENARLRRDNDKLRSNIESFSDDSEAESPPEPAPPPKKVEGCPSGCGVELRRVPTPTRTVLVCPECHWRKAE